MGKALYIKLPNEIVNGVSRAGAVLEYNGKGVVTKLVSATPRRYARFGWKMTFWGNHTLVISAPWEKVSGKSQAGAVYLKVRGQAKMTRLVSPTPT